MWPNPKTDESDTGELIAQVQRGNVVAQSKLLDRYRDRLRRMVSFRMDRRLRARIDPSDVVQEALAEAANGLKNYIQGPPVPFYIWLRSLAWQKLVRVHERHLRAHRRSVLRESHSLCSLTDESAHELADRLSLSATRPDHRILQSELKSRVLVALSQLSDRDRDLLISRHLEQLSISEIARILNCTEGVVRTRHTRALARLARVIDLDDREER